MILHTVQDRLEVVDALLQGQRLCDNCQKPAPSLYLVTRPALSPPANLDEDYWCKACLVAAHHSFVRIRQLSE